MGLKEALPEKSEPQVFLIEGSGDGQATSPVHKKITGKDKDFRIYFGYLIPNKITLIQMSPKYLREIQMKQGFMILYQFIQTVINLHKIGLGFGHIDLQNMFIGINRNKPGEGLKFNSSGDEILSVTRDFLFLDPNLQQIFSSK